MVIDRAVAIATRVGTSEGTETIASVLDDFRFAMAIHTGQYASFDTISFIIIFIKSA